METLFNYGLIILFLGVALFIGKKVFEQKSLISINCKYLNASRFFIIFCLVGSLVLIFIEESAMLDKIRTISMMALVTMLLCLRDGVGEKGFIYNGNLFPFSSISHYDVEVKEKDILVYVITRDKVKKSMAENTILFHFKPSEENELMRLLEKRMPKKHKRIKKG